MTHDEAVNTVDELIQAAQSAALAPDQGTYEDAEYWEGELDRVSAAMVALLLQRPPAAPCAAE